MTYEEIAALLNGHPVAQELLRARIPARLAYLALDGTPRAIPISYHWDGAYFYFSSPPTWPKVRALEKNPKIAFTVDDASFYPPHNLIVRGEVSGMELVQGLPEVYIEASRRIVGTERFDAWLENRIRDNDEMMVVRITPTFAKVVDFVTAFPGPS